MLYLAGKESCFILFDLKIKTGRDPAIIRVICL